MPGFLAPAGALPAYDDALADAIGDTVSGITGLDRDLVRPRWVPTPAAQPARGVDWCAVGVTDIRSDDNASLVHDPHGNAGDGSTTAYRGETIAVLASFYGPNASGIASLLRDGLMVQANRAALMLQGLAYASPGAIRNASGLVNTENLGRYDFDFVLRRRVGRTYAVPNIRSAEVVLVHARSAPPLRPPRPPGPTVPGEVGVEPFRVG